MDDLVSYRIENAREKLESSNEILRKRCRQKKLLTLLLFMEQ